jgi:hypothetical protein
VKWNGYSYSLVGNNLYILIGIQSKLLKKKTPHIIFYFFLKKKVKKLKLLKTNQKKKLKTSRWSTTHQRAKGVGGGRANQVFFLFKKKLRENIK